MAQKIKKINPCYPIRNLDYPQDTPCTRMISGIRDLIELVGENPDREGLKDTPSRVIDSWRTELCSGYQTDPSTVLTTFQDDTSEQMVVLRSIEFFSTCEHHLLPFFGKATIAYIPDQCVVGISKLARLLEVYSRRLQIQERLCRQVTNAMMKHLKPKGAACVLTAQHLCMMARGVNKQESIMITSSLEGSFLDDAGTRAEFMSLVNHAE